jgi:hypothetical protein
MGSLDIPSKGHPLGHQLSPTHNRSKSALSQTIVILVERALIRLISLVNPLYLGTAAHRIFKHLICFAELHICVCSRARLLVTALCPLRAGIFRRATIGWFKRFSGSCAKRQHENAIDKRHGMAAFLGIVEANPGG